MSYTVTQICNLSLAKVGDEASQMTSLDDDSKEANLCKKFYEPTLRELLESNTWKFSIERTKLSRSTSTPAFEWDYIYPLPADCIRPLTIRDYSNTNRSYKYNSEWDVSGKNIVTNAESVYLSYVKYIEDPNSMTALFIRCLYTALASKLAYPLTEDPKLVRLFEDELSTVIMPEARRTNSFIGHQNPCVDSEWIEASFTSGSTNQFAPFSQSSYGTLP